MWEQMLLLPYAQGRDDPKNYSKNYSKHYQTYKPTDGERVWARANLIVWSWKFGSSQHQQTPSLRHVGLDEVEQSQQQEEPFIQVEFHTNQVEGYIDKSKRQAPSSSCDSVFGFDDIFVVKATNLSYHEKKLTGCKCSPRDANLSAYCANHIHYKTRKQWSHLLSSPDNRHQRTISIGYDDGMACASFLQKSPLLQHDAVATLRPCFTAVVNDGAFFRAAQSRRQVNYWCPGLNAGLPFVPKSDLIHELTFLCHDWGHFLIPDLVTTGGSVSASSHQLLQKRVYVVWRMLSEAITLVFADMLLAEALRRSGVEYDWNKRAIWPLFAATRLDPFPESPNVDVTLSVFKTLLRANAYYCLLGDDSEYRKLLSQAKAQTNRLEETPLDEHEALKNFKEKYMPFFVEDYRWTSSNYDSMSSRSESFTRWWELVAPIRDALRNAQRGSQLETVEEVIATLGLNSNLTGRQLMERILDYLFETKLAPAFLGDSKVADPAILRRNALGRYMIGQMHLLVRYPFLPESKVYGQKLQQILCRLISQDNGVSQRQCAAVRSLYDQFVDILEEKGLITADDACVFSEICPLFEPCYVDYDRDSSFYDELSVVQRAILGKDENDFVGIDINSAEAAPKEENHSGAIDPEPMGCPCTLVIDGITFADTKRIWRKVSCEKSLPIRLRRLHELVGVGFWDGPKGWLVKTPVVAICALGGMPITLDSNVPSGIVLANRPLGMSDLRASWREGMGLASMPCYMNPGNKAPLDLWNVLVKHGHFSIAHTVSLSFFLAGFSCGVENELNSQRDVVHLARITVARTASQQQPPLVVQHAAIVPVMEYLRNQTQERLQDASSAAIRDTSKADWYEASNLLWPAAKSHCAVLTGSLRGFQKLVSAISDEGKEAEYRNLLVLINQALHHLLPEMFLGSNLYDYKLPSYFGH
uniref:Uncharacterized protein n=1 Tax=Amphora coffeiformis TaxID=265554 RepID=A0A7S3P8R9_9STRA